MKTYCPECHKEVEDPVVLDFGIGGYYWGDSFEVHVDEHLCCPECESFVVDENGDEIDIKKWYDQFDLDV